MPNLNRARRLLCRGNTHRLAADELFEHAAEHDSVGGYDTAEIMRAKARRRLDKAHRCFDKVDALLDLNTR